MTDMYKGKTAEEWHKVAEEFAIEFAEYQNLIAERQRRDRQGETRFYAVLDEDGIERHRTSDQSVAIRAVGLYDYSEIITWTESEKKSVHLAKEGEDE